MEGILACFYFFYFRLSASSFGFCQLLPLEHWAYLNSLTRREIHTVRIYNYSHWLGLSRVGQNDYLCQLAPWEAGPGLVPVPLRCCSTIRWFSITIVVIQKNQLTTRSQKIDPPPPSVAVTMSVAVLDKQQISSAIAILEQFVKKRGRPSENIELLSVLVYELSVSISPKPFLSSIQLRRN